VNTGLHKKLTPCGQPMTATTIKKPLEVATFIRK